MSRIDALIVTAAVCLFVTLTTSRACAQFWDQETKINVGILTAEIALDGYRTQSAPRWREWNPIARPLVNQGSAGQAVSCAIGLSAVVGTSYMLHKFHHDRLSRWALRISVIAEGVNDANNYRQRLF